MELSGSVIGFRMAERSGLQAALARNGCVFYRGHSLKLNALAARMRKAFLGIG